MSDEKTQYSLEDRIQALETELYELKGIVQQMVEAAEEPVEPGAATDYTYEGPLYPRIMPTETDEAGAAVRLVVLNPEHEGTYFPVRRTAEPQIPIAPGIAWIPTRHVYRWMVIPGRMGQVSLTEDGRRDI